MIRTIIKAERQTISISIPKDYIGNEIEIIAFAVDEATVVQNITDSTLTHFASGNVLAKDWLTTEEDKAWLDL